MRLAAAKLPEGYRNLWDAPHLLMQKFPAPEFTASCVVDPQAMQTGETAGLVVMGMDYAYLGVEKSAEGLCLVRRTCLNAERGTPESDDAQLSLDGDGPVELRVAVSEEGKCRFSARSGDEPWRDLGDAFTAREGKWIGAKVGLFCQGAAKKAGFADFDRFTIDSPAR